MAGTVLLKVCRAVVVMTVVVIGAVGASSGASATALHGRGRAVIRTHKFGRETSDAEDAGLISRLAVLRRPQTEADVLPAGVTVMGAHGVIIPTLTRLVAQPAGASVYLAVSTPLAGSPPLWSPKLGDQVGIVTVTSIGATETFTAPAADLTNAFIVEGVEGAPVASSQAPTSVYEAGIVPDGVARVRWTFANATAVRGRCRPVVVTTRAPGPAAVAASPKPSSDGAGVGFAAPPVTARTTACYQTRTPRARYVPVLTPT